MSSTIAISLSPNVFPSDIWVAIKTVGKPWEYNAKKAVSHLDQWFKDFFQADYAFSYVSGRACLYEILRAYGIGKGDEVILQAFTCVALPNAIVAAGATPIYIDILDNLTMDPALLEKKITKKTKAIIMQHTFGIPSDTEKICALAKKNKIPVIEDCAHGIGIMHNNKKLGQFGDVAFFSFGRDKAFSSVFGGMLITNDKVVADNLAKQYASISFPSKWWTLQQLFHPIACALILPLYDFFSLGKILLVFFQKLHMLSFPVTTSEKKGVYTQSEVKKLPGALAVLALHQLVQLDTFNEKRKQIASFYMEKLKELKNQFSSTLTIAYLRFPVVLKNRDTILQAMRKEKIYLGKWYANVIDPKGVDFAKISYTPGSCPNAETIAKQIINLPTIPRMRKKDAERVIRVMKQYV